MIKEIKWVNQLNVSVDKATQLFNLILMQKKTKGKLNNSDFSYQILKATEHTQDKVII